MATKSNRATTKDCKAGKTLFVVYKEDLSIDCIHILGKPFLKNGTMWVKKKTNARYNISSLDDMGVNNASNFRECFTTYKAASRFIESCKNNRNGNENARKTMFPDYIIDDYPYEYEELSDTEIKSSLESKYRIPVESLLIKIRRFETQPRYFWDIKITEDEIPMDWKHLMFKSEFNCEYVIGVKVSNSQLRLEAWYNPETRAITPVLDDALYTFHKGIWYNGFSYWNENLEQKLQQCSPVVAEMLNICYVMEM